MKPVLAVLKKECEKINAELQKLSKGEVSSFEDLTISSGGEVYFDEVVEPINGIFEKYGYEPWDASDIQSGGLPDGMWDYGQTLTYRKKVNGKEVYVDVSVLVEGWGSSVTNVSIKLDKLYSYDYDANDNPIIYFARRLTENGWEDCTDELEGEL